MYTVKAIYDGANFKLEQPISLKGKYEVIITFVEPISDDIVNEKQRSKRPVSELRGILKGKVWMSDDFNKPLEEMKEYME